MKEKLVISFCCYLQHSPFTVTLSRMERSEEKFKIEAIVRTGAATGTALQTESEDPHKTAMDDMDFDGFFCPWCATRDFVRCGTCGAMSCLDDGWEMDQPVALPCGHGGTLSSGIKEIDSRKESIGVAALSGSATGGKTAGGSAQKWKQ